MTGIVLRLDWVLGGGGKETGNLSQGIFRPYGRV